MLLVGVCNLGFIRGTMAGFGNMTGQLTPAYVINYLSNYPDELGLSEQTKIDSVVYKNYVIKGNDFVLEGYEFVNWNTFSDGSGDTYLVNDSVVLEKSITLYAQWKKIEVINVSYGDVNINWQIDEEDYLLIENFVNNGNNLTGQALLNADVNNDGKVDLLDADIIKQAYLGTDGYVGFLPRNPILKYEIYVDETDDDIGSDDQGNTGSDNDENKPSLDGEGNAGGDSDVNNPPEEDNENSSSSDNTGDSTGTGNGTGTSGSGNSSSGNGGTNSKPSGGGNNSNNKKPNSSNGSSGGGNQDDSSSKEEDKNDVEIGDKEEDKNVEDTTNTGNDNKNKEPVNKDSNGKSYYVWIIVILMCFISLRLILYVINRFRKSENNNKDE